MTVTIYIVKCKNNDVIIWNTMSLSLAQYAVEILESNNRRLGLKLDGNDIEYCIEY